MKVFLILKWNPWAETIKNAMSSDAGNKTAGNQIPVTNKVANAILETPTKFRVKSLKPKVLNSAMTLWNLKVQTKATDIATAIWASIDKFSILKF